MSRSVGKFVGARLKKLRNEKGLTQPELADRIGVDTRQIVRYEKEEIEPGSKVLIGLATELETTTDYLLGLIDDPTPRFMDETLTAEERALIVALRNRQIEKALQTFTTLTQKLK